MKTTIYTKSELIVIKDCKTMGYDNKAIAKLVNKKFHHGANVRTSEGIRKKTVTL